MVLVYDWLSFGADDRDLPDAAGRARVVRQHTHVAATPISRRSSSATTTTTSAATVAGGAGGAGADGAAAGADAAAVASATVGDHLRRCKH